MLSAATATASLRLFIFVSPFFKFTGPPRLQPWRKTTGELISIAHLTQPRLDCAGLHSLHPSTDHKKGNRVANGISLKTELETENRGTQFGENAEFWGVERGTLPEAVFLYLESFDFHI
jgi:hypothetical protein